MPSAINAHLPGQPELVGIRPPPALDRLVAEVLPHAPPKPSLAQPRGFGVRVHHRGRSRAHMVVTGVPPLGNASTKWTQREVGCMSHPQAGLGYAPHDQGEGSGQRMGAARGAPCQHGACQAGTGNRRCCCWCSAAAPRASSGTRCTVSAAPAPARALLMEC